MARFYLHAAHLSKHTSDHTETFENSFDSIYCNCLKCCFTIKAKRNILKCEYCIYRPALAMIKLHSDQQVEFHIETSDACLTFPSPSVSTAPLPAAGGQGPHGEPGTATTSAIIQQKICLVHADPSFRSPRPRAADYKNVQHAPHRKRATRSLPSQSEGVCGAVCSQPIQE